MKLWKYVGVILMVLGVAHLLFALAIDWQVWARIAGDGFLNAIDPHVDRNSAFWFLSLGLFTLPLGYLCDWTIRTRNAPLPAFMGWWFVILGVFGAFFVPVSGFWTLIALGLIVLFSHDRTRQNSG